MSGDTDVLALARFLVGKTTVFFSGSQATHTTMNGTRVSFATENDLSSISVSATKVFQLQINDDKDDPMLAGTQVGLTSVLNANGAAATPAAVPNIAPHNANGVDDPTG